MVSNTQTDSTSNSTELKILTFSPSTKIGSGGLGKANILPELYCPEEEQELSYRNRLKRTWEGLNIRN